MQDILDLDHFPLHLPDSAAYASLVKRCQTDLAREGMFNLDGFFDADAAQKAADDLAQVMANASFTHARRHNIYFRKDISDLPADHPALTEFETVNHTLCADQLGGTPILDIYRWGPLRAFIARVMDKPVLHPMDDPLAAVNVMAYGAGEALNWHFDRSEFTTTLLLQAPETGGAFEYRTDLRTDTDPNYDGVARLLRGEDPDLRQISPTPGTLNIFRGKNTPHRVTPVEGDRQRVIAVFSYYEQPGVRFSKEEQIGFYGRAA